MTESKEYSVLIVDDIESIRFAITDFLKTDFQVHEAENGKHAIEVLEKNKVDLIITDIRMPEMGGLELIAYVAKHFPHIKYALMTAFNVNEYIKFVRKQNIWNIIPKTTFLDLNLIKIMALKLLTNDIFGVNKYYADSDTQVVTYQDLQKMAESPRDLFKPDTYYTYIFETVTEYDKICESVGEILIEQGAPSMILQVLEELATNALIRAPRNAYQKSRQGGVAGKGRDTVSNYAETEVKKSYELSFGVLKNCAVISVIDFFGTLNRDEILYRLERHVTLSKSGLPLGINDSHGRGLFISREHMDHLIFNIKPGEKTEVIGILALDSELRYRAVSIYQMDDK